MRLLYIELVPTVAVTALHEYDRELPGRYAVEVDATLPDPQAAAAALDGFHDRIAVEVLDDFAISVTSIDGVKLAADPEHEDYSLLERVGGLWRI